MVRIAFFVIGIVLTNVDLHIAEWVGELTFPVPNNYSCDALLSPRILSSLRVPPVGVSVLFGEDLTLQRDQVAWLAIAAISGGEIEDPKISKRGLTC